MEVRLFMVMLESVRLCETTDGTAASGLSNVRLVITPVISITS